MTRGSTPPQTIGPFFHDSLTERQMDVIGDEGAPGARIVVQGRVFDGSGAGVDDALIEIWQADAGGQYPSATKPTGFRGFGRYATDDAGRFSFETIKPGALATDRRPQAPHINVHVFARGLLDRLATRIYFDDEDNTSDPVLSSVAPDLRERLLARASTRDGVLVYRFDIVLQGDSETVFFDV